VSFALIAALALPGDLIFARPAWASASLSAELMDYLVQDVCVDPKGTPIASDPASCDRRRNLRPGEPQLYIMTDYDRKTGATFQASSSLPVRGTDGHVMVLLVKSLEGSFSPNYHFSFLAARDAFDLIDVSHSAYASIVRTFDGRCLDQVFSRNGSRKNLVDRSGGWVLFPLHPAPSAWSRTQWLKLTTWRMQLSPKKGVCADNHAAGITSWTSPARYTFESGKTLTAIRSDHFAAANLRQSENSLERTYFTREYGLTRWEAWQTRAYCQKTLGRMDVRCRPDDPANPWQSHCSVLREPTTGLIGVGYFGGQEWVRTYCRDQTHYISLKRPQLFLSADVGRGYGVMDVDFARTVLQSTKL
jgi:hypothetical protein